MESERRRLARDLHDVVGSALAGVRASIQVAARQSSDPDARQRLDYCLAVVDGALRDVRAFALDLRPAVLDDVGLAAAVRGHLAARAGDSGMTAVLNVDQVPDRLAVEIETVAYRIFQEALANAIRHGGAATINVELRVEDGDLELVIADDGRGFDLDEALSRARRGASLGLLGMLERALMVGGVIEIITVPGGGTRVIARLPHAEQAADDWFPS